MADISTGRQRGIVPFVDETTGRLPDQYVPQGVIDLQGDLEQAVTNASQSATAAKASETAAKASADSATQSASAAAQSAESASGDAAAAKASADGAASSASAAKASETAAASSATAAAESKDAAKASETAAAQSAQTATEQVSSIGDSVERAAASATSAAQSASQAQSSTTAAISALSNISTPFLDKIYQNEILIGYDPSDLTISGLQLGSNANFVTLIVPVRFRPDSYIEVPFESAKYPNGFQSVFFDSDWNILGNYSTQPDDNVVRIDFSELNPDHMYKLAHFAFSTSGPLYKIKYHNVLDSSLMNIVESDFALYSPEIPRIYKNTFVAGYVVETKEPYLDKRVGFTSLVVAVDPSPMSKLQFPYHNVEGDLAGKAQVLYLDDSFKAIVNKEVAEQNQTCTITFDTVDQQRASYVMFSTSGSPDAIRYDNVLDSSMMNIVEYDSESDFLDFGIFRSIACLGDSYTAGSIADSSGTYVDGDKLKPWPSIIAQRFSIDATNYGVGGSTTKSYWTNELSRVLSGSKPDGYFYCWGINDSSNDEYHKGLWDNTTAMEHLGSVSDIVDSESETPNNTFYGYYSSIIMKCKAYSPSALHTIIVMPLTGTSDRVSYRNATIEIANSLGIPYMDPMDDQFFFSDAYTSMNEGHPTRLGYIGMARAYTRLFSKCVAGHVPYYKNVVIG